MQYNISPNITLIDNGSFGIYSKEIIFKLLLEVDINFSLAVDKIPFSSKKVLINQWDNVPNCMSIDNNTHLIHLSTKENYWCQWIYQFSHEYCHHLIDGELVGDKKGLIWFEECICELASMWQLYIFFSKWSKSTNIIESKYALSFKDYLDNLLESNNGKYTLKECIDSLNTTTPKTEYERDKYNIIATNIYTLFIENHKLWKIILNFGDMRRFSKLEELFEHLITVSTDDYKQSLLKLNDLLL